MSHVSLGGRLWILLAIAACSPPDAEPLADSPAATSAAAPRVVPPPSMWSRELGRFLVLPVEGESLAVVLFPDSDTSSPVAGTRITLLNAAGDTASVTAQLDTLQCADAPIVRLSGAILSGWWLGLQEPTAELIRMDSVESLPRADSARITTALARLASTLAVRGKPDFKGLPFVVARARRFMVDEREVVVAHLVRRVPQEAAPLEEHTFLIAERPPARRAPFETAYSQQSDGTEENAEHFETLAAARSSDGILLLLARDRMLQSTYQILSRSPGGNWSLRWSRDFRC